MDIASDAGITGVTAEWKSGNGFDKNNATSTAGGNVTGTITLKLNSAAAEVTLNLPIAQFPVDKTGLTSVISDANTAKDGIVVNDKAASSVANGTRFVTTAEMNALTNVIAAAQAIANSPASTAEQVSAAATALNNAVATFKAVIKIGKYTSGSGGSTGGASGGGSSSPSTPSTKPTEPVTGESKSNVAVDNKGNATVNVTGTKTISDVTYTFNSYGETTRTPASTPVPASAATTNPALPADGKKYITYKVVRGDILWDLARKYGTTVDAIVALNNIQNSNVILVGIEIKIPRK